MNFSRNLLFTSFGQILSFGAGLAFSILVARQLGAEGQGLFTLWLLVPTLAARFAHFGFDAATAYFIKEKSFTLEDVTSTALTLVLIFFVVAAAAPLLMYFKIMPPIAGLGFQILLILVPMATLFLARTLFFGYLIGQGRLKLHSALSVIEATLPLLFVLALVTFRQITAIDVISCICLSILIVVTLLMLRVRARLTRLNPAYIWAAARYGIKSWLNNLTNQLIYRVDMVLIAVFLGPFEVGLYSIAVLLVEKLWFFLNAVGNALFPAVRELDLLEGAKITTRITRTNLFLTIIMLIVLVALAGIVISILFGDSYKGSIIPLYFLLPGALFLSVPKVLVTHLGAIDRLDLAVKSSLPALILNIALNLAFIPPFGIAGAAVATSISYLLYAVISIQLYRQLTGLKMWDLLIVTQADLYLLFNTAKRLIRRA